MTAWPAKFPRLTLMLVGLLCALSVLGLLRLHADASVQSMFPAHDPAADALVRVLNRFSVADELLLLVSTPADQQADAAKLIDYAVRFSAAVKSIPQVKQVAYRVDDQSRQFFAQVLAPAGIYYLNDSAFAAAKQRLTKPEMVKQIRQNEAMAAAPGPAASALAATLLQDPLRLRDFITAELTARQPVKTAGGSDAFLSPDGRHLLIRIAGVKPLGDLSFAHAITDAVDQASQSIEHAGLTLDLSGGYAIAAQSEHSIRHDMILSVTGSVLLLQALFVVAYSRPIRSFLLAFAPVAIGVLLGFGVRSLLGTSISPAAAVVGGILAGLGIDYTVLYLPHYHRVRSGGASAVAAATQSIRGLGGTLIAACVTSVIGFVAVGASSVPALRDFALVGALGLGGALVMSMTVLPALLVLSDRRATSRLAAAPQGQLSTGPATTELRDVQPRIHLAPMIRFVARHRRPVIAISLAIFTAGVVILLVLPGPLFPLESDLTVMHPRPNPPLEAEAKIARVMGTDPGSLMVYLRAETPEQLVKTAYAVDARLHNVTVKQVGVSGSYGLATLLPDPAVVARRQPAIAAAESARVLADFRDVIADSSFSESAYAPFELFLQRMLAGPPAPTLANLAKYPRLADTMLSRSTINHATGPVDALTLVFFDRSLDDRASRVAAVDALRRAIADVPGATLTGLGVVGLDTERVIQHDLPRLMGLAIVLVAIYLLLQFRDVTAAGLAMVPAIFSLVFRLAAMRVTGQSFNLINLVSLPMLVGIDVDYGIFIVSLARKTPPRERVDAVSASAHSITVSALSNVLGFGSLITTSVPAIRSLGWAVGTGILACYVATMFLLAPLVLGGKREA